MQETPKLNPNRYGWTNDAGFRYLEMRDVIHANEDAGGRWFDAGNKRFFRSRIGQTVYQGPGGYYFTTSEQFDDNSPRLYSVRQFDLSTGSVSTVGEFQSYATGSAARRAAVRLAKGAA